MKSWIITILLGIAIIVATAHAATINITDNRCVNASPQTVHDSITDYSNYVKLPGARYGADLKPFGTWAFLTMVKTQAKFLKKSQTGTDAYVWVVLQPTNLTNASYYPYFMLRCKSSFDSAQHFTHECELQKNLPHYGLSDFHSALEVTGNSNKCRNGQTYLSYVLSFKSDDAQVSAIKVQVLKNLLGRRLGSFLKPTIDSVFHVKTFFKEYYLNFYKGWASTL